MTNLSSWIEVKSTSDFSIHNIPFGIFKTKNGSPRVCSAIGEFAIDLALLNSEGFFKNLNIPQAVFENQYLNDFIALGKPVTNAVREQLISLLSKDNKELQKHSSKEKALIPFNEVEMLLPVKVGDYTDFYSSIDHATNVGTMFRDPANALLPNWKHLPVGYHGRSSSIIVSGENFHRPKGQVKPPDAELPSFSATKLMDFELEVAFIIGKPTHLGDTITTEKADDHIFGLVLFNDWSARDIQTWEYVPLGPFLAKNFASSISPWVITLEALEPFRIPGPVQQPEVLPYLKYSGNKNIDINLEVYIQPENLQPHKVCHSNYKHMYWNMNQQLAHHTINGCNVNVGDMMASGTISGKEETSFGSMLELTWRGTKPIKMPNGTERKFINDNDTVIMKGYAEQNGIRVGFGEVKAKVLPAKP